MVRTSRAWSIIGLGVVTALLISCDQQKTLGPGGSPNEQFVVSIAPDRDSVAVGATLALTATVRDGLGTVRNDQPVSWNSLTPQIATVDNIGLVTGLSVGTAHVVARVGAYADTATLFVQEGTLILSVAPELIQITLGDSIQLEAALWTPSGTAVQMGRVAVLWESSDASIASISSDGLVASWTPGDVTFTASVGGTTAVALARVVPNPVASISVTPANSGLYPGEVVELTATMRDVRGRMIQDAEVTWSSSAPSVATVTRFGAVRGISPGSAIITATSGAKKATAAINVFPVPAAGVVVTAASNSVTVGGQLQAVATVRDEDGNVLLGKNVAWSSSNPSVAQVGATGIITGLTTGSTTIHAVADSKIGTLPITVIGPMPTAIEIVPGEATVPLGASATLRAEVTDQGGNVLAGQLVSWSSTKPAIATVNAMGVVTGVGSGTTTIRATSGSLSSQATITVVGSTIASISVTPSSTQLQAGGARQLTATAYDAGGSPIPNAVMSWSSSNPIVASVSAAGLVTAIGSGNATITATSAGKSATAVVSVNAPPPPVVASVTVTFNSSLLTVGQSTQARAVARDAAGNVISGRAVTWTSDDPTLASVSAAGLVVALASGSASIVAKVDGVAGVATLTINGIAPLPVFSVQLSISPSTINAGQTAASSAVLRDSLGGVLTGFTIGYTSSKANVASVGMGGVITGVSAGSATITATSQGKSGSAGVTVNGTTVPVASVTVSGASSLTVSQSSQATATTRDASGNVLIGRPITWSSSNPSVATVSATGVMTGVAVGSTQIVATSGTVSGSLVVNVSSAPAAIATVTVSLARSSIPAGTSTQASAVARDASGQPIQGITFFWSSSSASTATVSQGGVVVGVAVGSANITASAAGKSGSAAVAVTQAAPPSGVVAVPPALPNAYVNSTYTQPTGQTIFVPPGGNLQTAIDQAQRGDVITLQPGATYTGNFVLRAGKAGTGYITIRTAMPDPSLPPQGTRLTPSRYASILPKLQTGSAAGGSVFITEIGASGYRLLGLEITAATNVTSLYALVQFGDGGSAQNTLAKVARDLIIDRSYIHGHSAMDLRRCVNLNSAWSAIVDSYLSECHAKGSDSQAISGWNGPGPFKIVNNYLEGAGENVMFGGADPSIPNLNPSDIEIRGNHFYKPTTWANGKWTVKNLLELKQAVRVLIEDNIFENCWIDGQTGFALVFKSANQSGAATWAITSDVTFRYNVVRNSAAGVSISANPSSHPALPAARFLFEENIFEDIGTFVGSTNGRMIMLLQGLNDIEIRHNTLMHNAVAGQFILMDSPAGGQNLVVRNNLATWGGPWGAVMGTAPQGSQALAAFMNPYAFEGNLVIGMPSNIIGGYPLGNFYPSQMSTVGLVNQTGGTYGLIASSPYKGKATDGRDPGADGNAVRARTANVVVP